MFRQSKPDDIPRLIDIWVEAFEDEKDFPALYFSEAYRPENVLVCEIDGKIISMVSLIPCTIHLNESVMEAGYVYAFCTDADYRGEGLSRKLFDYMQGVSVERGYVATLGFLENDFYLEYYKRFGYMEGLHGNPDNERFVDVPDYMKEYGRKMLMLEGRNGETLPAKHTFKGLIKRRDDSIPQDVTLFCGYTFD